jgi:YHS domain-containing protein
MLTSQENNTLEVKELMAKDPVCGMNVEEKTAKFKSEFKGKNYYFCNQMCKVTFEKNPAKYASSSGI